MMFAYIYIEVSKTIESARKSSRDDHNFPDESIPPSDFPMFGQPELDNHVVYNVSKLDENAANHKDLASRLMFQRSKHDQRQRHSERVQRSVILNRRIQADKDYLKQDRKSIVGCFVPSFPGDIIRPGRPHLRTIQRPDNKIEGETFKASDIVTALLQPPKCVLEQQVKNLERAGITATEQELPNYDSSSNSKYDYH